MHRPTWGVCAHQAPGHLSCSDLGRVQNAGPAKSVPLWSTQEPEPEWLRPGKCTQPRAHFRQFPGKATWSPSSVDQESTHTVGGTIPVWPTLRAPNTRQWCLFAVFLPPRSTTEQVSLNKGPPSPSCVRAEIRHWGDLRTEAKINSKLLWKWQVQQIKTL